MKKIVIPVHKHWSLLNRLLKDIHTSESDNVDDILVVDDFSQSSEIDETLLYWSDKLPLRYIKNEENLGFTLSSISGLHDVCTKSGVDDAVFLISSDVEISGKFIDHVASLLKDKVLVGHKLLSGNTGWNHIDGKVFPYLEGYFLACTAYGWTDLGYFDPQYAPWDFEDVDLSTNAIHKGYKLVPSNNPVIKHLGGRSIGYTPERESVTLRNKEYFRRKWLSE